MVAIICFKKKRGVFVRKIMLLLSFCIFILICLNPALSASSAHQALTLCLNTVIPSLFPFFVSANLLISLGGGALISEKLKFLTKPLFKLSGAGALPVILGLLSGYPLGAATTCSLYTSGAITKNEAHRLLSFANNSGPLFIISAVGLGVYQSEKTGLILYASHALAALTTGIIASFFGGQKKYVSSQIPPSALSPSAAVSKSVESVLSLCGYVIFFAVLLSLFEKTGLINLLLKAFLALGVPFDAANLFSRGIFEMTTAISKAKCTNLPAVSAIISLGGISVLFQTMSYTRKSSLSIMPYIIGKIISGGFAAFYTQILIYLFPVSLNVFSPFDPGLASPAAFPYLMAFMLSGVAFLFFKASPQGDR